MATSDLPAVTLALWAASDTMPASEAEIAAIAARANAGVPGAELPGDYLAFLRQHGFVSCAGDAPARFASDLGGGTVSELLRAKNMGYVQDQTPEGFVPVAGEYGGHDLLLMRMTPPVGEIWHLDDSGEVALVAPDFTSFLEGLFTPEEPRTIRWTGTPERDPATGFVIAAETRAAWAKYYTGSTPEPADELAAIEADLGRPLPEALRSFLDTYGYVTFFGDGIPVDFDLPPGAGGAGDPAPRAAAAEAPAQTPPAQMPLPPAPPDPEPLLPIEPEVIEVDPAPAASLVPKPDTVEDQLKRAKLEEQLRRNRMQAAEEAQRAGQLMEVADAREQMARIAVMMLQIFEGALPDFAAAMVEKFDVPQRDVLHLMRAQMVEVRRTAVMKERARADAAERDAVAEIGEGD